MRNEQVVIVTGTGRGIGKYLVEYYTNREFKVVGCSRGEIDFNFGNYRHFSLDVCDEEAVRKMFSEVRRGYGRADILINNAGVGSMNHAVLTPFRTAERIVRTNVLGTFLFCREAAKLMQKRHFGRIVNMVSIAHLLKLEGEAVYAASKAAVVSLTEILAREFAGFGVTVNAVGPSPVQTDLIKHVEKEKIEGIIGRLAIPQYTEFRDIVNVIDFFIKPESRLVTGQVVYLGGI